MNAHKVPSRSMAIENLMNSQKTALLRPRVLQEAQTFKVSNALAWLSLIAMNVSPAFSISFGLRPAARA